MKTKRHKSGEKWEHACGCIYVYRPGPEGWVNWSRCKRHIAALKALRG